MGVGADNSPDRQVPSTGMNIRGVHKNTGGQTLTPVRLRRPYLRSLSSI